MQGGYILGNPFDLVLAVFSTFFVQVTKKPSCTVQTSAAIAIGLSSTSAKTKASYNNPFPEHPTDCQTV